jgi:predicted DNA-binding transcriptional regulator AlpA
MAANRGLAGRRDIHKHIDTLPLVGHSRWKQIEPFVGVSRETWRKLCLAGRAPQPIQLSPRCTVWRNNEIHMYLNDSLNYRGAISEADRSRHKEVCVPCR